MGRPLAVGTVPGAGRAAPCGVRAQLLDVLGAFQGPLPGEGSACDARGRWRLSPLSQCSDFLSSQKVPRPHPVVEGKWEGCGSSHCPQATPGSEGCPLGSAGSTGLGARAEAGPGGTQQGAAPPHTHTRGCGGRSRSRPP